MFKHLLSNSLLIKPQQSPHNLLNPPNSHKSRVNRAITPNRIPNKIKSNSSSAIKANNRAIINGTSNRPPRTHQMLTGSSGGTMAAGTRCSLNSKKTKRSTPASLKRRSPQLHPKVRVTTTSYQTTIVPSSTTIASSTHKANTLPSHCSNTNSSFRSMLMRMSSHLVTQAW